MKYFAQPDYNNIQIQIYYLPPGAPAQLVTIVPLANSSIGPNDVVLYQDAGGSKMFVSYDLGGPGLVEIYDFTPILAAAVANTPIGTGTTPSPTTFTPASPTQIQPGNSVVGMAIQPGTGDLYAATFNNGNTSAQCPQLTGLGGVIVFTAASGYDPATASQFSDYHDKSVTTYSANLAFDEAGNLWMTTWDAGPGSTPDTTLAWEDQFLICYLAIGGTLSKSTFFKLGNTNIADGSQVTFSSSAVVTLPPSPQGPPVPLLPFSAPEGIAFDPNGNLWVANNNDFVDPNGPDNGTLVMISAAWIAATC